MQLNSTRLTQSAVFHNLCRDHYEITAKFKKCWVEKGRLPVPLSKIDVFVNHVHKEHNQEADLWANIGAQGQRKMIVDRSNHTETWKAVTGFWDGRFKDNGKSGCGVVIKGVDRVNWVTINKIAVPLKVGTAMAAEVMGVCVITEFRDLVFNRCLCISEYQSVHTTRVKKVKCKKRC